MTLVEVVLTEADPESDRATAAISPLMKRTANSTVVSHHTQRRLLCDDRARRQVVSQASSLQKRLRRRHQHCDVRAYQLSMHNAETCRSGEKPSALLPSVIRRRSRRYYSPLGEIPPTAHRRLCRRPRRCAMYNLWSISAACSRTSTHTTVYQYRACKP
jgi:hypothetical protein